LLFSRLRARVERSPLAGTETKPFFAFWETEKKVFPRISSGTSRTNTTQVFTGGHGQENDSGRHEAVSICFFSRLRNGGTFLRNGNHNETLGRVLGDKTKLILRLSRGTSPKTPNHVLIGEYGHEDVRGAREAVSACFVFTTGRVERSRRALTKTIPFFAFRATKTSYFRVSSVVPRGQTQRTLS